MKNKIIVHERDEETGVNENGETVFSGNKLHYRRFCEADKTRYAENGNN